MRAGVMVSKSTAVKVEFIKYLSFFQFRTHISSYTAAREDKSTCDSPRSIGYYSPDKDSQTDDNKNYNKISKRAYSFNFLHVLTDLNVII